MWDNYPQLGRVDNPSCPLCARESQFRRQVQQRPLPLVIIEIITKVRSSLKRANGMYCVNWVAFLWERFFIIFIKWKQELQRMFFSKLMSHYHAVLFFDWGFWSIDVFVRCSKFVILINVIKCCKHCELPFKFTLLLTKSISISKWKMK